MHSHIPRIAIVSALLDPKYGGPASVLRAHVEGLSEHVHLSIFGGGEPDDLAAAARGLSVVPRIFPLAFPRRWYYCRGLSAALRATAPAIELIHAHMVWDHPVYAAWRFARGHDLPLVVTPHGSLNQDGRQAGGAKALYRYFILNSLLRDASAVHVLNRQEEAACRELGVRCPIHVIPNGLPRARFDLSLDRQLAFDRWPQLRNRRVVLYLGRIWSGKGLDILPLAWAQICAERRHEDWVLVIAGPDYRNYQRCLVRQLEELDILDRVVMTGAVYGEVKAALFATASVFVLPSHGEGFSMAVLEALASSLPVLATCACNFQEIAEYGAGVVVPDTTAGVKLGLEELLEQSDHDRIIMGQAGWRLGVSRYTLETVSADLMAMYLSSLK